MVVTVLSKLVLLINEIVKSKFGFLVLRNFRPKRGLLSQLSRCVCLYGLFWL